MTVSNKNGIRELTGLGWGGSSYINYNFCASYLKINMWTMFIGGSRIGRVCRTNKLYDRRDVTRRESKRNTAKNMEQLR